MLTHAHVCSHTLTYAGSDTLLDGDGEPAKREGLISRADMAVYLREFGTQLSLLLLVVISLASVVLSVGANVFLSGSGLRPHTLVA